MTALDRHPYWARMCRRLPFGAWLIGPAMRAVISAALDDAAAFRRNLDSDCNGCPTDEDITDCLLLGVDPPTRCPDHQLDQDAVRAYEDLLYRIGVTGPELAKLRAALYAERGHRDGK